MKHIVAGLILVTLAGCSAVKSGGGEKNYQKAKSTPSLTIPSELEKTTKLSPLYKIPKIKKQEVQNKKVTAWPPQFIGPGKEDKIQKS